MKLQNWWVKPSLLTSGIDPTKELSMAAEQFPDEFTPMVYIAKEMGRVRDLGYLQAQGTEATTTQRDQFYAMKNIDPIPTKALPLFSHFLSEYNQAAMQLRTVANDEIGAN